MNLPNKLTLIRIFLVPVCMLLTLKCYMYWALGVFMVASVTDFFDGYIARKYNLVTSFGKIMDPLADKILVFGAMLCFLELGFINSWCVAIILAREFFVTGMRVVAVDKGKVIAASRWGKVKTNIQIFSVILGFITFAMTENVTALLVGRIGIYIATVFTAMSWVAYIFENKEVFKD